MKTALITGSSLGIGAATAREFAKRGWNVVVTYNRDDKEAKAVAKSCEAHGVGVLVHKLNVLDDKSIKALVKAAVKEFGHVDCLVNNAGVIVWNEFKKQSFADIEHQLRVNVEGLMKVTSIALPHVKGTIVNIASAAGKTAYDTLSVYCATKFAVRGFTQALALENRKLKVYAVNPDMTKTRMTKFKGRPPEDVANIVVNAAEGKYKVKSGGDLDVWDLA